MIVVTEAEPSRSPCYFRAIYVILTLALLLSNYVVDICFIIVSNKHTNIGISHHSLQ